MSITKEEAIRILSRYDTEYYTPNTREAHRMGIAALKELDIGCSEADKNVGGKWIPVTERLPEEGDRCLCNVKSFAFPGSYYQDILRYDKLGFREGSIYTDDVTHWMPLPDAPEVVR